MSNSYLTLDGLKSYNTKLNEKIERRVDSREVWENVDEMLKLENWPHKGSLVYSYVGLIAYIESREQLWVLKNKELFDSLLTRVGDFPDVDTSSPENLGWSKIDAAAGGSGIDVEVVDSVLKFLK